MDFFTYRGLNSYDNFGIIINSMPPAVLPERRVDFIEVDGRDGYLIDDKKTYKGYTLPFGCTLWDETLMDEYDTEQRLTEIKSWLSGGEDDLIVSTNEMKKHKAIVTNRIDISQSYKTFGEFPIIFSCQPYREYAGYITPKTITTSPFTIANYESVSSLPKLTIYGSGTVSITINGRTFFILNLSNYIIVDSQLMDAYKNDNGIITLCNNQMVGDFPTLDAGKNVLSFTGSVTKIVLEPNWRSL